MKESESRLPAQPLLLHGEVKHTTTYKVCPKIKFFPPKLLLELLIERKLNCITCIFFLIFILSYKMIMKWLKADYYDNNRECLKNLNGCHIIKS